MSIASLTVYYTRRHRVNNAQTRAEETSQVWEEQEAGAECISFDLGI